MRVVLDLTNEFTNTIVISFVSQQSGNPDILKSMSTSLNVEDEPTGCLHTTGLTVLS